MKMRIMLKLQIVHQADIDGLVTKLQAALIDNQAAIAELDTKAQEKVTAAQQSKKVTKMKLQHL